MKLKQILFLLGLQAGVLLTAQVQITNAIVNTYNINPEALCQVNMLNQGAEADAYLEVSLGNASNEKLISITTNNFRLKQGMNLSSSLNLSFKSVQYSSSAQGEFVKTRNMLPSGSFKYCVRVIVAGTLEVGDEWCEDLLSETDQFLILVTPFDKDTIETSNPMLIWTHSEPFNILSPGEYFRMTVVELSAGQDPESGVNVNTPVFQRSNLLTHNVPYPLDAPKLEPGKRYGWHVQKISNGTVINKTEAWEFIIKPDKPVKVNKYAVLKKKLDGGFYTAEGNRLYFRFQEEYNVAGKLNCMIYDSKRKMVEPKTVNENKKSENGQTQRTFNLKENGYNRFEVNMDELNVKTGYYTLEVRNEKNEIYLLKFYVE